MAFTGSFNGQPILRIYAAVKDFDTGKSMERDASLFDCATTTVQSVGDGDVLTGCTQLGTATATFDKTSFGGDFGALWLMFPSVSHTFGAGRELVVMVLVDDNSDDDAWLAFANTGYPTKLYFS